MTIALTRRLLLISTALLILVTTAPDRCVAGAGSASLLSNNGELVVQVDLPAPPPVNLIAKLKLQKTVRVESTLPEAAKIDKKKSVVTWLVKKPRSGNLTFSVKTSPPSTLSAVSAVITYRDPADGSLITIHAPQSR